MQRKRGDPPIVPRFPDFFCSEKISATIFFRELSEIMNAFTTQSMAPLYPTPPICCPPRTGGFGLSENLTDGRALFLSSPHSNYFISSPVKILLFSLKKMHHGAVPGPVWEGLPPLVPLTGEWKRVSPCPCMASMSSSLEPGPPLGGSRMII